MLLKLHSFYRNTAQESFPLVANIEDDKDGVIDYVDEFEGMSIFVGNLTEWKQLGGNLDFPKKISFKVKHVRKN